MSSHYFQCDLIKMDANTSTAAMSMNERRKRLSLPLNCENNKGPLKAHRFQAISIDSPICTPDLKKMAMTTPEVESLLKSSNFSMSDISTPLIETVLSKAIFTPNSFSVASTSTAVTTTTATTEEVLTPSRCSVIQKANTEPGHSFDPTIFDSLGIRVIPTPTDNSEGIFTLNATNVFLKEIDILKVPEENQKPDNSSSHETEPKENKVSVQLSHPDLIRRRERNRVAAQKCRQKKNETISQMRETIVNMRMQLDQKNEAYYQLEEKLHVLRSIIIKHTQMGCTFESLRVHEVMLP